MQTAIYGRYEYLLTEHLLLALTEDEDARKVLAACNTDIDKIKTDLRVFLTRDMSGHIKEIPQKPSITAGFQRVVQRAAIHVESKGGDEVTGAHVLLTLFSERDSHAVFFLQSQGMTRPDVASFILYGSRKTPETANKLAAANVARPLPELWVDPVI